MKQGVISIQLNYKFEDDVSNEDIKWYLQEVELPSGYEVDTFEYIGIWNTTTNKYEEEA
jgi:hypothetical protein